MTLDEAIKHAEEVAYQKDLESGFETDNERCAMTDKERTACKECANEHRQLAEWLKDYKRLKEQTRWIPVSERLPEKEDLYLVTVKNEHDRKYSKTCWFHGDGNWFARQDVIAWVPLPEPYKAEVR